MTEILKPTVKDYFEPLKNLHKKEYPLEPRELKDIVESTMEGLLHTIKRLDKMRKQGDLTEEEQVHADSFLFYCQKLVENKVSPIGIRAVKKNNKKNLFYVSDILIKFNLNNGKTVYSNIIQDSAYVSHGWLITENNAPRLKLGNFHLHFVRSPYNPPLLNLLKNNYNGEIINIFINQLKNKQLLWGDINYGKKNSPLSYIDLNGKEVATGKTKYEAWEEFKDENPKLLEELVKMICDSSLLRDTNVRNKEIYPRLIQAFTLLRIKGFVLYPNLTA